MFSNDEVIFVDNGKLPHVKTYIGHNSSLLTRAFHISDIVILWKFEEEPELFFSNEAFAISHNEEELKAAIQKAETSEVNLSRVNIESISAISTIGAFKETAKKLSKLLK